MQLGRRRHSADTLASLDSSVPLSYAGMGGGGINSLTIDSYSEALPTAQQPSPLPYRNWSEGGSSAIANASSNSSSGISNSIGNSAIDPVVRRLCDDTYVPTQTWPADPPRDAPYCQAVTSQLIQFGGSTSISKLRGFLRNRINAPDNIKSVPLKAMLAAYPHLFVVRNNQVALVNANVAMSSNGGLNSISNFLQPAADSTGNYIDYHSSGSQI